MEKKRPFKRRILLIQYEVQMAVIAYAMTCGVLGSFFTLTLFTFWQRTSFTEWDWRWAVLIGGGFAIFLFMIIIGLYLTNRIVGPLYQLHRQIQAAVKGEEAKVFTRKGDFFAALIDDTNRLFKKLRERSKNEES